MGEAVLSVNDENIIKAQNVTELAMLADRFVASGFLPKNYQTSGQVITAWQYAGELGLKPMSALRQIAVVNGTPSIFGDLPLSLVERSGLLESKTEIIIDEDMEEINWTNRNLKNPVWGAVCIMKRKGRDPVERFFTVPEAEQANLFKNDVWRKYTKMMLKYRARSQAIKDAFSDVLGGVAICEYDHDVLPEMSWVEEKPLRLAEAEAAEAESKSNAKNRLLTAISERVGVLESQGITREQFLEYVQVGSEDDLKEMSIESLRAVLDASLDLGA